MQLCLCGATGYELWLFFYKPWYKLCLEIKMLLSWILWISWFVVLHALSNNLGISLKQFISFMPQKNFFFSTDATYIKSVRYKHTVAYHSHVCLWSTWRHSFTRQNPLVGKLHPSNWKPKKMAARQPHMEQRIQNNIMMYKILGHCVV